MAVPTRRLRPQHVLAALAVAALLAAPVASSGAGAAATDGQLGVSTFTVGGRSFSTIFAQSSEPIARTSIFVPQGYAFDLGLAEAARVGDVSVFVQDAAGSFDLPANGELVVADPARYEGDPAAQGCAPGGHAAVWRASLTLPGRRIELTIFVDPAGATAPAGSAFALTACTVWPSASVGQAHLAADGFGLFLEQVVRAPSASGCFTWSALVTPLAAGSLQPDEARAFEVRSVVPLPRTLTLRARHDERRKSVVLSGRLLTLGRPEAGVPISIAASVPATDDVTFYGPVRTNAAGEFSLRRHVDRTTEYTASVASQVGPCTAPSAAPAGCASETVAPPGDARAAVLVRTRTDARLVPRRADRVRARAANLRLADFPPDWFPIPLLTPFELCPRLSPDLSALTATGEAWSSFFAAADLSAIGFSSSAVYRSEGDARAAFGKQAVRAVADCVARDSREEGATVHSVGRLSFPRLGHETRAFRIVASDPSGTGYLDLVSFRRGRTVVHLVFSSLGEPLASERALARAVAARARASS